MQHPTQTAELLTALTDRNSSDVAGQKAITQWVADYAKGVGLGTVNIHPYPAGSPMSEHGLSNITIDVGGENGYDELALLIGHIDVVPASTNQRKERVGNLFYQRGAADMLGQVAAFLLAMKDVVPSSRRRFRLLLTTQEEGYSEGAHAAGHDSNNLTRGASFLVTGDINSHTHVKDTPDLLVGGVGRVSGKVLLTGKERHSADLSDDDVDHLLTSRSADVLRAMPRFAYPEHTNAPTGLFPRTRMIPTEASIPAGAGSSLPTNATIPFEIHYSDDRMNSTAVFDSTGEKIAPVLGSRDFILEPTDRGGVPFSTPWLTDLSNPLIGHALHYGSIAYGGKKIGQSVYKGSSDADFVIKAAGKASAKTATSRVGRNGQIPTIGFYAAGEAIHEPGEVVDLRSVEALAAFIRLLSKHDGPLTEGSPS